MGKFKIKRKGMKFYFGPSIKNRVAILVLNSSKNNMFFTLTDLNGLVLATATSGLFRLKRDRRINPVAAELLIKRLIDRARFCNIRIVRIVLKMTSVFITNAVVRYLMLYNIKVDNIVDRIPVPHNGCRKKKLRRI